MSDEQENITSENQETQVKVEEKLQLKKKPSPKKKAATGKASGKPGRPPQKSAPEGSRIPYQDRHKIAVKNRLPGYKYRNVNSDNGKWIDRVEVLQDRGYTFASDDEIVGDTNGVEASSIGSKIGKPGGKGVRVVLMKQKEKHYIEDQAAKQAEVDQTEEGMVAEELREADDTYGPGLKVERSRQTPSFDVQ